MTTNTDSIPDAVKTPIQTRRVLNGQHSWMLEDADGRPITGSRAVFMTQEQAAFIASRINAFPGLVAVLQRWFDLFAPLNPPAHTEGAALLIETALVLDAAKRTP